MLGVTTARRGGEPVSIAKKMCFKVVLTLVVYVHGWNTGTPVNSQDELAETTREAACAWTAESLVFVLA